MRETLFKAKSIATGEWVEGALLDEEKHCLIGQEIKFSPYTENECKIVGFKVDRDTICQYTGLTDKNGNKIWENDVVSFTHSKLKEISCDNVFGIPNFETEKYQRNYVIEYINTWCTYGLRFRNGSIHFPCKQSTLRMYDCEVIGNIFDNPELLEGGGQNG